MEFDAKGNQNGAKIDAQTHQKSMPKLVTNNFIKVTSSSPMEGAIGSLEVHDILKYKDLFFDGSPKNTPKLFPMMWT